ncbi:hypothetical protein F4776DRAFT_640871 [Hypoxylon sp. NC0597]|nr:hypothetical protein F4776DRAFT_640871 [Hypoxylon sp. NC0597]
MFNRKKIHTTRRTRERRRLRRRRRQLRQANTSVDIPPEGRRDQHTVDELTRDNTQYQSELGLEITTDLNENHHRPRQYQVIDNYEPSSMPPRGENSERLIYDRYSRAYASADRAFFGQQAANNYDRPTLGGLDYRLGDHTHHVPPNQPEIQLPVLTYSNLGEYMAQQQVISDYTLETWRAQSLQDGPLRVVPELHDLRDWSHYLGSDYERESEAAATGGRTP